MSKRKKDKTVTSDNPHGDHIEFSAEVLTDALALLKPVLLRRAIRKDLASYHFEARAGGLVTISASDELVRVQLKVEALSVVGIGRAMIDVHAMNALLGAYSEPRIRVHLHHEAGKVRVEGLKAKMQVPAYDPEKELKNPVPSCSMTSGWMMASRDFLRAVEMLIDFTDPESTRYALGGLCLMFPEGEEPATFVATDGRRLAEILVPVARLGDPAAIWRPSKGREEYMGGRPVLVNKAAKLAVKLAKRHPNDRVGIGIIPGEPIDLEKELYKPGKIQFVTRDAVVTCDLPEGRFPLYRDVYPEGEPKAEATLDRASKLNELVTIAAASVDSESKGVEVTLAGECIMLETECATKGKGRLALTEVPMIGRDTVTLDALWFRQILDVLGDDPVVIRTFGMKQAVVLQSGIDWKGCLMPLTRDASYTPPTPTVKPEGPMHEEEPEIVVDDEDSVPIEDTLGDPTVVLGDDPVIVPEPPAEDVIPEASEPEAVPSNGHAKPSRNGRKKK